MLDIPWGTWEILHLWLSLITFMVVEFITFMGKFYYIYG